VASSPPNEPANVTRLLRQAGQGERQAWQEVYPWVEDVLRMCAHGALARNPLARIEYDTCNVLYEASEAAMKRLGQDSETIQTRQDFIRMAVVVLRRNILDAARSEYARKQRPQEIHPDEDLVWKKVEAMHEGIESLPALEAEILTLNYLGKLEVQSAPDGPTFSAAKQLSRPEDASKKVSVRVIAQLLSLPEGEVERLKANGKRLLEEWFRANQPELLD